MHTLTLAGTQKHSQTFTHTHTHTRTHARTHGLGAQDCGQVSAVSDSRLSGRLPPPA